MPLKVELLPFGDLDLDQVFVNGRRCGLLPHADGATLRFVRLLKPAEAEEVRTEVARLRQEQDKPAIAESTIQPPDPKDIAKLVRQEKSK